MWRWTEAAETVVCSAARWRQRQGVACFNVVSVLFTCYTPTGLDLDGSGMASLGRILPLSQPPLRRKWASFLCRRARPGETRKDPRPRYLTSGQGATPIVVKVDAGGAHWYKIPLCVVFVASTHGCRPTFVPSPATAFSGRIPGLALFYSGRRARGPPRHFSCFP